MKIKLNKDEKILKKHEGVLGVLKKDMFVVTNQRIIKYEKGFNLSGKISNSVNLNEIDAVFNMPNYSNKEVFIAAALFIISAITLYILDSIVVLLPVMLYLIFLLMCRRNTITIYSESIHMVLYIHRVKKERVEDFINVIEQARTNLKSEPETEQRLKMEQINCVDEREANDGNILSYI